MTSAKIYRDIFDGLPAMVCEFSAEGIITYANRAYRDCFNLDAEEISGRRFLDPGTGERLVRGVNFPDLVVDAPASTDLYEVVKDGGVYWQEWTVRAYFDSSGGLSLVRAVGIDTTERKRAEFLLQSRLALREFADFHSIEDIVVRALEEAEHLTASPESFLKLTEPPDLNIVLEGWSAKDFSLVRSTEAGKNTECPFEKIWTRCLEKNGPVMSGSGKSDNPDHTRYPFSVDRDCSFIATPVFYLGRICAVLGVAGRVGRYGRSDLEILEQLATTVVDAIGRKLMEASMLRSKEKAESASRAKSEFLANMSHEIRTPVNGIVGMLQLLEASELNSSQKEYAGYALQASTRLNRLLSDILDLTCVEAGKLELKNQPFDLEDSLNAVRQMFIIQAGQKGLALDFRINPDLPDRFDGDATRLQQILGNLVGNAIKFTETGIVVVEVDGIQTGESGIMDVSFSVHDSGCGIPEDRVESLFEPFTQLEDSYVRNFQGAGLGLSICRRLVELYGGTITVESTEGSGATFRFVLPLKIAGDTGVEHSAETEALQTGLRVLYVDDDKITQLATSITLKKMGCRVQLADNGAMALQALVDAEFDVVLMDIQMPVMDGVSAIKAVRSGEAGEHCRSVPIIAMTAYAMTGDDHKFMESGANGYLAKPVLKEDLEDAMQRVREYHIDPGDLIRGCAQ
ncbi:ATP-binding protein [Maridesulfovibrio sp.]|uniref:ATP-binding protein n=1 Tax=Maridesulfovibrio sp. TaxID=2795000 RepID=UPI002A18CE64|nr:ATP-binding protein [Maridesulfovibrio sp.]